PRPLSTLSPYTTLFRSPQAGEGEWGREPIVPAVEEDHRPFGEHPRRGGRSGVQAGEHLDHGPSSRQVQGHRHADVVEFARARRSHRGRTCPGSHSVGGFLSGARAQLLRVMDAGGHLGGGDPAEVEQSDTDADGPGQGTPADLVDADDEIEAFAQQPEFDAEVGQSPHTHQFPVIPSGAGTSAKTSSGLDIQLKCLNGQLMRNTVPTRSSSATKGSESIW